MKEDIIGAGGVKEKSIVVSFVRSHASNLLDDPHLIRRNIKAGDDESCLSDS